jgi:anti-anti-sigma factor
MTIIRIKENGIIRIVVSGRLDADSAPKAEKILKKILAKNKTSLLFDLCELEYMSSAGLRVILYAAREVYQKGGKIVLCCLNEILKEIFESSPFPVRDSVEAGLEEFL